MNRTGFITLAALAGLLSAKMAFAQTSDAPAAEPIEKVEPMDPTLRLGDPDKDLHVQVAPYVWITSFSGNATIKDIEVDVDETFIDIYDKADSVFGLMGAVDVEYKRFVFQFNVAWLNAEFSESNGFARNGTLDADLTLNSYWYEWFAGYRIIDEPLEKNTDSHRRFTLDAFGGIRLTQINLDADLRAREDITLPDGGTISAGESTSRRDTKTWLEPFVGARIGIDLTEHWSLSLRGDIGGFGIDGSSFAWQTIAAVGYRWRLDGWDIALFGGYRALGQDYEDGSFGWDVITHGPILGTVFSFAF